MELEIFFKIERPNERHNFWKWASYSKGSCVLLSCCHGLSLAKLAETAERENGLSSDGSRKLCETDTGMSSLTIHSSLYQPAEIIFLQMAKKHQVASLDLSYLPDSQSKTVNISVASCQPLSCYALPVNETMALQNTQPVFVHVQAQVLTQNRVCFWYKNIIYAYSTLHVAN